MEDEPKPQFRVDIVDQFQGHWEEGYVEHARFDRLEDAIAAARRITEAAIAEYGSVKKWHGMGDAGLVYDARGRLVWDGVEEYSRRRKGRGSGFRR